MNRRDSSRLLMLGFQVAAFVALPLLLCLTPPPAEAQIEDAGYRNQMRTARRLAARDQHQEALDVLNMVFRKHPHDARAINLYVDALLALDRSEDALAKVEEAMAQPNADLASLHRTRVNIYFQAEDWPEAFGDLVETLRRSDSLRDWSFKTTEILLEKGLEPAEARSVVARASEEAPENMDLLILRGILDTLDGAAGPALERMTQRDRALEEEGRFLLNYAERLVDMNLRDEAKRAVEAAAGEAVKPTRRSNVLFRLSDLLQEEGNYEEALVHLATIAEEREGTSAGSKALIESAAIYREFVKDCRRALGVYDRLQGDPTVGHHLPELLLQKAECLVRLQDYDAAMLTYDDVFPEALDPEHAERAAFGKASVMFYAGDPDSALTLFQEMAETYPRSLQTDDAAQRYIMLNAYAALGGGEAMSLLGRVEWAREVGDSTEVVAAAEELIEGYPRSEPAAEALMVLGAVSEERNLPAQALGYYDRVVRDHAQDRRAPLALKKQGDLLVQLERPEEALEKLEQILTDYSESIVAGETRRMVEKLRSAIKS